MSTIDRMLEQQAVLRQHGLDASRSDVVRRLGWTRVQRHQKRRRRSLPVEEIVAALQVWHQHSPPVQVSLDQRGLSVRAVDHARYAAPILKHVEMSQLATGLRATDRLKSELEALLVGTGALRVMMLRASRVGGVVADTRVGAVVAEATRYAESPSRTPLTGDLRGPWNPACRAGPGARGVPWLLVPLSGVRGRCTRP